MIWITPKCYILSDAGFKNDKLSAIPGIIRTSLNIIDMAAFTFTTILNVLPDPPLLLSPSLESQVSPR